MIPACMPQRSFPTLVQTMTDALHPIKAVAQRAGLSAHVIRFLEKRYRSVDEQRRGPCRLWIHEHFFEERDGGTKCVGHVSHFVLGGRIIENFLVRRDVEHIFSFRRENCFNSSLDDGRTREQDFFIPESTCRCLQASRFPRGQPV